MLNGTPVVINSNYLFYNKSKSNFYFEYIHSNGFIKSFYPYTYYVGIFLLLLATIGYLLGTKTNSKL